MKPTPTVYQRIMEAYRRGKGLRLTYEDVFVLSADDCITTRAERDDMNEEGSPDEEHV